MVAATGVNSGAVDLDGLVDLVTTTDPEGSAGATPLNEAGIDGVTLLVVVAHLEDLGGYALDEDLVDSLRTLGDLAAVHRLRSAHGSPTDAPDRPGRGASTPP